MPETPRPVERVFADWLRLPGRSPLQVVADLLILLTEGLADFFRRGGVARAAALTYTTLLSLIPLVGLVVVVFKQVGGFPWLEGRLRPLLAEFLNPDGSEAISEFLLSRAGQLELGTLGLFGVGALAFGVYSLISTVETDFNLIWRVRRSRGVLQRLGSYWLLMTLLPVVAGVSVFLSGEAAVTRIFAALPDVIGEGGHLLPMLVQFAGFFFLYWALPNTRVQIGAAAVGAAFASASWELAKIGFAYYTALAGNYNVFYGSLAALPLFMLWVFLSWTLILVGAEISFVIQNRRALLARRAYRRMGPLPDYLIAVAVRDAVLRAFEAGEALGTGALARLLGLPETEINGVVGVLVDGGLLHRAREDDGVHLLPALPPAQLGTSRVIGLFLRNPAEFRQLTDSPFFAEVLERLSGRHRRLLEAFGDDPEPGRTP
jgi:membrane protein